MAARSVPPLFVLTLALFLFSALGAMVTCHDGGAVPRTDVVDRVAASEPMPGSATCPGCLPAPSPDPAPAASDDRPAPDPCTSEHPCHHGSTSGHATGDSAVRAPASGEVAAPAVLPVCTMPHHTDRPAVAVSATGPVPPPAVRAPVPVLCVDRN